MSESPPCKRFKQTKITQIFKRQASVSDNVEVLQKKRKQEDMSSPDFHGNNSSNETDQHNENTKPHVSKSGEAAIKRKENNTPFTNRPPSCQRSESFNNENGGAQGGTEPDEVSNSSGDTIPNEMDPELNSYESIEYREDSGPSKPSAYKGDKCKGLPRKELRTTPEYLPLLGDMRDTKWHKVLCEKKHIGPREDKWDNDNVKLPCSTCPENLCPISDNTEYDHRHEKKTVKYRWEVIKDAFSQKLDSSYDIEKAIMMYNSHYSGKWNFDGLHSFFEPGAFLDKDRIRHIFVEDGILDRTVKLALRLPELFPKAIPLLRKNEPMSVTFSQEQIASLLANAFLCTFPRRNSRHKRSEYSTFPEINFSSLFQGYRGGINDRKVQKLICILHYFERVTNEMPNGNVTFKRQVLQTKEMPDWQKSMKKLTDLHVTAEGNIEDDGLGMLQVDFANKFVGGGVLGHGCVQEEIRFLVCPEMIVSRLITEVLNDNECLIMTGCERFSRYSGYGDSFRWEEDYIDTRERDTWGRRCTEVVAIDALVVRDFKQQFTRGQVRRELDKAYVGFKFTQGEKNAQIQLPAVATGNWGCGAFGGDLELKALIQLMAAAEAGRQVCYFTFNDYDLMDKLYKMHKLITEKSLRIKDLSELIHGYHKHLYSNIQKKTLFKYVTDIFSTNTSETDDTSSTFDQESQDYKAYTP